MTKLKDKALIIFFKYPEKQSVKTRLAASIGEDHSLGLYKSFLADVFEKAKSVDADTIAAPLGGEDKPFDYAGFNFLFLQKGPDLGSRMYNSFLDAFSLGYSGCVLMGCDCPDLPAHIINDALLKLDLHDTVLGPAADGGYYLIGFRRYSIRPEFFSGIQWGTHSVLSGTLEKISRAGLSYFLTPMHEDIDDYESLVRFKSLHSGGECIARNTMRYLDKYREALYGKKI